MRYLLCCILCCLCFTVANAQVNSEEVLVNRVLITLQSGSDSLYTTLFSKYDELFKIMQSAQPGDENGAKRIANIRSNPQKLQQFDPQFNPEIVQDFDKVIKKGKDSGLHWTDMLITRYELEKAILPKELIGLEKIIPIRMQGYIFVQDLLTRRTYAIALKDIHSYNNKWYGGHVVNILEAESIDEYIDKLAAERKMEKKKLLEAMYGTADESSTPVTDSVTAEVKKPEIKKEEEEEEEKKPNTNRDVVERKVYTGRLDNEIDIELYVRSLKGACPQPACAWEAIYKFGDQDEYIKLEVNKTKDGKWQFTEDEVGMLEVTIKGDKLVGTWTSMRDKTEYDAVLTEKKEVKSRKLFQLDSLMEE